jgi:hypothetical protein
MKQNVKGMEDVLTNKDLVRNILKQSSDAFPVLAASRQIRRNEPCTAQFERWSSGDCPIDLLNAEDETCLSAAGGRNAAFCTGSFHSTTADSNGWPSIQEASVESFNARVQRLLKPDDRQVPLITIVLFQIGETTLRMRISPAESDLAQHVVSITRGAWRYKGLPCKLTREKACSVIRNILTSTGEVHVPCPPTSNVRGPIRIGRRMRVKVSRWDENLQQEWLLVTAFRE